MNRFDEINSIMANRDMNKESITVITNKLNKYVNDTINSIMTRLGYNTKKEVEVSEEMIESIVKKYYCSNIFYAFKYPTKAKEIIQNVYWDSLTCVLSYGGNSISICRLTLPEIKKEVLNAINYSLLLQGKDTITMNQLEKIMRNTNRFNSINKFGIKDQIIIYTDNLIDGTIQDELLLLPNNGVYKRWVTKKDNRVRKSHQKVTAKWIDSYKLFEVGGEEARYPRDNRLSLKEKINCRCELEYKKG